MNRMIPLALVVIAAVALGAYFLLPSNVQNVAVADETVSSEPKTPTRRPSPLVASKT